MRTADTLEQSMCATHMKRCEVYAQCMYTRKMCVRQVSACTKRSSTAQQNQRILRRPTHGQEVHCTPEPPHPAPSRTRARSHRSSTAQQNHRILRRPEHGRSQRSSTAHLKRGPAYRGKQRKNVVHVARCVERRGAWSVGDPGDRLRAGSRSSCCPPKTHWRKAEATLVASVGCVVKRPTETGGDREIPGFRGHILLLEASRRRKGGHGCLDVGGHQTLGGVGTEGAVRIVSAVTVSGTWALCVLVKEGNARAVLQGGTGEVGVPVKET